MMSKRERRTFADLLHATKWLRTSAQDMDAATKAAIIAAEKLLGTQPQLVWRRRGLFSWTARHGEQVYGITRDPCNPRGPFWLHLGGMSTRPSGYLPTLQQAKAYCEQKARS